jgi:serine/threonine-protein kinase RsbW
MLSFSIEPHTLSESLKKIEQVLAFLDKTRHYKALLICEEVITNQLRHGNFHARKKQVEFSIDHHQNSDALVMIFKDNAEAFNPLDLPEPDLTLDLDERALGGLGVFMIKKYALSLDYRYENRHNILEVRL